MKKIYKIILFTTLGIVISFTINTKIQERSSLLTLRNLEALADQESNNEGSGIFYYEHLLGKPQNCTLYKYFSGGVLVKTSEAYEASTEYQIVSITGIKELCPKNGSGCTVYSCRET